MSLSTFGINKYGKHKRGTPDEYRYSTRSEKAQRLLLHVLKLYIRNNTCESTLLWDEALREAEKLMKILEKRR